MGLHYEEAFENFDRWINRPAEHADWQAADGAFTGHWLERGNTLVFDPPIVGDASLEVDTHVLPFDGARTLAALAEDDPAKRAALEAKTGQKNFNILWMTTGPEGEDFYEAFEEWFGKGKMGLEFFRTYFFTFTLLWARLRRSPGYELMSDRQGVISEVGKDYAMRVEQTGSRLRQWINGDLIHDFTDPRAYRRGRVGFVLSTSQVRVSRIVIDSEA